MKKLDNINKISPEPKPGGQPNRSPMPVKPVSFGPWTNQPRDDRGRWKDIFSQH